MPSMLQLRIARTEELLAMSREALARYEQQLLESPDDWLRKGQVRQTKDFIEELTQDLNELREEQARLTTQPHESLHT